MFSYWFSLLPALSLIIMIAAVVLYVWAFLKLIDIDFNKPVDKVLWFVFIALLPVVGAGVFLVQCNNGKVR